MFKTSLHCCAQISQLTRKPVSILSLPRLSKFNPNTLLIIIFKARKSPRSPFTSKISAWTWQQPLINRHARWSRLNRVPEWNNFSSWWMKMSRCLTCCKELPSASYNVALAMTAEQCTRPTLISLSSSNWWFTAHYALSNKNPLASALVIWFQWSCQGFSR